MWVDSELQKLRTEADQVSNVILELSLRLLLITTSRRRRKNGLRGPRMFNVGTADEVKRPAPRPGHFNYVEAAVRTWAIPRGTLNRVAKKNSSPLPQI
jgi:hypothetical protein